MKQRIYFDIADVRRAGFAPVGRIQKMGTSQEQFGYCVRLRRVSRLVRPAHEPARREGFIQPVRRSSS